MGMMSDLAEMVDSIMDRASAAPEMAVREDMVKVVRDGEDRVDPVVETEIPLLPAIPVQTPGKQTPEVPAPIV